MENLSFIPGVAGASAIQNIGAYGVEAADLITTVNAVDVETGSTRVFRNEECCYGYRESVFKKELKNKYFITSVCYRLSKISGFNLRYGNLKNSLPENPTLAQVRETIIRIREEKLPNPAVIGNAGSFFMNPVISKVMYEDILTRYDDIPCYRVDENNVKVPAAYLIEKCGWKGAKHKGAGVYEKQPLVIVNNDNATAEDIIELADNIVNSVYDKFNIRIKPEVNYI